MRHIILACFSVYALVIAAAAAQISADPACVAQMEQQYQCTTACVNQTWPDIARCTNSKLAHRVPDGKLEACITRGLEARARAKSPELSKQDPVAAAFKCAGG